MTLDDLMELLYEYGDRIGYFPEDVSIEIRVDGTTVQYRDEPMSKYHWQSFKNMAETIEFLKTGGKLQYSQWMEGH